MGDKQHFFQFAILIVFGILATIGVVVIATVDNSPDAEELQSPIVIWGPQLGDNAIQKILDKEKINNKSFEKVSYVEKNSITLYDDLLEAIATGKNPDLVIINSSGLLPLKNKLHAIPFETVPVATYNSLFIQGASAFVLQDAVYAFPLLVDPLVLYWNRDLYATAGVTQVPKEWDSFVKLVPSFSKIISGGELVQSAIAFGEYENVLHAKEILSSLYMQTGASIVYQGGVDKKDFVSDLATAAGESKYALALKFYTSFSDPNKTVYSWNKSFDRSREMFAANKVAMYGGFVSEQNVLAEINPNLNYGLALWPQLKNAHFSVTYGDFYAIAVIKKSKNIPQALYVAQVLANKEYSTMLSELTGLPSARLDVLATQNVEDPYSTIKMQSALISRTWLEPAPQSDVSNIFSKAINTTVSGIITTDVGTTQIASDLDVLLKQYSKE